MPMGPQMVEDVEELIASLVPELQRLRLVSDQMRDETTQF